MRTDPILTLTQWLSPAFPVGAFTYSHGLEAAVEAGWVTDGASLKDWLKDLLTLGSLHMDAHFFAAAARGTRPLAEINDMARAYAPCKERLLEAEAQGRAFCKTVSEVWAKKLDGLVYPVALGAAVAHEDLGTELVLKLYLQSLVTTLINNAQRLGPIGQTEAQSILRDLTPLLEETAREAADGELSHIASAAFLSDIAAMKHETQYSRIFRS